MSAQDKALCVCGAEAWLEIHSSYDYVVLPAADADPEFRARIEGFLATKPRMMLSVCRDCLDGPHPGVLEVLEELGVQQVEQQ